MLTTAIELGMTPDAFWSSTPRELALCARAHARRAAMESRGAIALAWHVAAFMRLDKLPPLREVLAPAPRAESAAHELARRAREHDTIVAAMRARK